MKAELRRVPALRHLLALPGEYGRSLAGGFFRRRLFEGVETFFIFVGHPRSGHSLLRFLLEAHRHAACSQEGGALRHLAAGFSRRQILSLVLDNCRLMQARGQEWSGYRYRVEGQWQGRFEGLRVMGDKQGGGAVLQLAARPRLLGRLREVLGPRVAFLHVVRNPFDNIATIARRNRWTLARSADFYFTLCRYGLEIRRRVDPADWMEVRHEAFVESPAPSLAAVCRFLGLDAPGSYLEACAAAVFPEPRRTRDGGRWTADLRRTVERETAKIPHLEGYVFDR